MTTTSSHKAATMAQSFAPVRQQCAAAGLSTARVVSPRHALVPSATRPGVTYHVVAKPDGVLWCSCPNHGASCWHSLTARILLGLPTPPPVTRQARAAAALEDLYGPEVLA